ncbi:MAG: glycosyltransferase family 39 protein [Chloroflexaceae bacterium]|nr:glycosyltransferase family 39 protein [Chloroflexaceae bacterium]
MIVVVMLLEIAWLCLAGWAFFYTDDTCLADALALGIGLTLVSLSVSFQLAFLFGFPVLSFLFEASLLLAALFILRSRWRRLLLAWQRFRRFVAMYWLTAFVLGVCGSYLLLLALLLPVSNVDSIEYNLARVLLFQEQHTLLLSHVTTQHQAVQPVGSDIFAHMFLRFDTDYGTALFSFLAYLVIGFGSYALARRYATPQLALCATLIVISMPKMVYQATSTKNDLVSAAAALLCLLLLYRLIERPSGRDLLLLALMMSFGISVKPRSWHFCFLLCY